MTLINRLTKHSDKMTGRQRVVTVDVDISKNFRPWITVHRADESGESWNHHYVGWRYLRRGRLMQDVLIEKETVTE